MKSVLTIFFVGLFLRIFNLTRFPIFTDEAIYLYWAKKISQGVFSPFMPLGDGKTFLYIWTVAALLKASLPYLLAGRIISVVSFVITFFFLFFLIKNLKNNKTLTLTVLLIYSLNPYNLFFERMALMDGLLTSFSLITIYFSFKNTKEKKSFLFSLFAGLFLAIAFLTKPTAKIFFYSMIFFWVIAKTKSIKEKGVFFLASITPLSLCLLALKKAKAYHIFNLKTQEFIYPVNTNLKILIAAFLKNFFYLLQGYSLFFGFLFIIFFIIGLISLFLFQKKFLIKIAIPFLLAPLFAIVSYAKILFSRHVLFLSPLIIIVLAFGIIFIKKYSRVAFWLVLTFLTFYFLFCDWQIITIKENLALPQNELNQYIYHHPSGFGTDKLIKFLKNSFDQKPFLVVTDTNFGLFPYFLELEFEKEKDIIILGTWKFDEAFLKTLKNTLEKKKIKKTYFVFNDYSEADIKKIPLSLKLTKEIWRPKNRSKIMVYELIR